MNKISCLLLAAGESRRMGEVNKLLLPIAGKSLVRRTAEELLKFPFQEIIVITGHDAAAIEKELFDLPVKLIHNTSFRNGMHSSIRTGLLNSWVAQANGFMICMADQPLFNVGIVERLAEAFAQTSQPRIVFPSIGIEKGHPVLISTHFVPEIIAEGDGDYGCQYLFKRHPTNLIPVEFQDRASCVGVDTPEQYKEFAGNL